MKKALLFIAVIALFLGCKKEENSGIPIVGKWKLVADTVTTFSSGVTTNTQINTYTKAEDHDLAFESTGVAYSFDNKVYEGAITWETPTNQLKLNFPQGTENGVAFTAHTTIATVRVLNSTKMLLYYPPVSTNGTAVSLEYKKL